MKALPWILAGIGIGAAASYILLNQPAPRYATTGTGYDDVEEAAADTALWSSKQRVKGKGGSVVGKVKEGIGRATGNDDLASEGVVDQAVGTVKDTVGELGNAAAQTLHDLNK